MKNEKLETMGLESIIFPLTSSFLGSFRPKDPEAAREPMNISRPADRSDFAVAEKAAQGDAHELRGKSLAIVIGLAVHVFSPAKT